MSLCKNRWLCLILTWSVLFLLMARTKSLSLYAFLAQHKLLTFLICTHSKQPQSYFLWVYPLTLKIWLLILLFGCLRFPNKLVTIIWCLFMKTTSTWSAWVFSLLVCWTMYGYWKEKLDFNHFWELKGWRKMLEHIKFFIDKTKEYWIAFFCQLP